MVRTGYTFTGFSGDCDSSGNVTVVPGEMKTCTVTNNDDAPSLTLVKVVTDDNGGTATEADFTLTATGPTGFSGPGPSVSNGPSFDAGTYALSESGPAGYSAGVWVCVGGTQVGSNITVANGESATCTITNDDQAATLIVIKHVVNDNGGSAIAADFTLDSGGDNDTPDNFAGSELGTTVTLDVGSYNVSETGPVRIYWGNEGSAVRIGHQDGSTAANLFTGETPCGLAIDFRVR